MRTAVALLVAAPWVGYAVVRTLGLEDGWPLVGYLASTPYVAARGTSGRCWTDAADAVGEGLARTWPVTHSRGPHITIDHVLVRPGIGVRAFSVHDVPATDHRAVIARRVLR